MNRSDLSFLELMFQCSLSEIKHQIIIVNQSKTAVLKSEYSNIRIFNDCEFGLSRSRNLALRNCNGAFAWILDDDVQVLQESISVIVDKLNAYKNSSLLVFKILTPKGADKRVYSKKDKLATTKKELFHIHSIEMIFNTAIWRDKNFRFDTRFGLGSQFKMGEEYVLSQEIISQKCAIMLVPEAVVVHAEISTANDPSSNEVIYARGAIAAHENLKIVGLIQLKYIFFLFRKGYIKQFSDLRDSYRLFKKGVNDYINSLERYSKNDVKQ
ncbi:hypothetical protein BST94_12345 [Nonlabens xylanidelens]|nr:hypothetical protein BST94_12345 [Nonlabens xylanidelens]